MANPDWAAESGPLHGALLRAAWQEYGGAEPAAEVVTGMASLLIAVKANLDDGIISTEQYEGYSVAMFDLAGRLGVEGALKTLHIQPQAPEEGRGLDPTFGDDKRDAYECAVTVAIVAVAEDTMVEAEHNGRRLTSYGPTPISEILDQAGFRYDSQPAS